MTAITITLCGLKLRVYISSRTGRCIIYQVEAGQYRLEWVRPLLEAAEIFKYLHNAKYAQVLLMRYGLKLQGIAGDTMLAAYIDAPSFEGDDLAAVIFKYLDINVPDKHPALLVSRLRSLLDRLEANISSEQESLLKEVEMPVSEVLAHMEFTGIKVERENLQQISGDGGGNEYAEDRYLNSGTGIYKFTQTVRESTI